MSHPTTKHYSQEVAFFEGFLDPYMKYSSSLFEGDDESLDVAVVRMLDKQIELGRIHDDSRVLDVGNGWGCFFRRLTEKHRDIRYTGVNPSAVQLEYISWNIDSPGVMHNAPIEVALEDLEGPYEAIYLLGALCHIREKAKTLKSLKKLLADDGRVVMEDTFFLSEDLYQLHAQRQETKFVQDEVFGCAHVHSLARHFDEVREAGFRVMYALDNSDSYARSAEIWIERLRAMDPQEFPQARQFVQYMDIFQRGWGYTICNHLMVLEKLPQRRQKRVSTP